MQNACKDSWNGESYHESENFSIAECVIRSRIEGSRKVDFVWIRNGENFSVVQQSSGLKDL